MDDARPRIAVIEDDGSIRDLIRDLLEFAGYTVVGSPDCERGYAFVRQERPDLVILDPFASGPAVGLTTLERLASDPETAVIPTLICSTAPDAFADERASKHPGTRSVAKPFEVDDLLGAIETMLSERRSEALAV